MLPKELRIFALALTPSAAIHLALMLRSGSAHGLLRPRFIALIYGVGLALGFLNSMTYFGPPEIWIHNFRAGYVYVCIGAASFLLITGNALRRSESDLDRSRLRVMFVGALLGFLLPALMTVLTSTYQIQIPYNLALIPTIFFPISVAYALLKYSLFDLGNALRVGLSRIALLRLVGSDLRSHCIFSRAVDRRLRQRPAGADLFLYSRRCPVQSAAALVGRSGRSLYFSPGLRSGAGPSGNQFLSP